MLPKKGPYKDYKWENQVWNTREDGSLDIGTLNEEPSMCQQQFTEECDINNIMKNYMDTGTINHLNPRPGVYGDFSQIKDFHESMETIVKAQEVFDLLPAKVRSRFSNNPAELVEFCQDPKNQMEAIALGLADKPQETQSNANNDQTKNAIKTKTTKSSSTPAQAPEQE